MEQLFNEGYKVNKNINSRVYKFGPLLKGLTDVRNVHLTPSSEVVPPWHLAPKNMKNKPKPERNSCPFPTFTS